MKLRKLLFPLITLVIMLGVAGQSYADISNAAVLYLRIAPGARPAGMGEAFVAIADDATATHWNPAGLGAYPLASSWIDVKIPERLQPISSLAAIRRSGGNDYQAYEIWAVTPLGLARYDNSDWYLNEKFGTRTDQTVRQIIARYFNIDDEKRLDDMVQKVALANNAHDNAYLEELTSRLLASLPDSTEYTDRPKFEMLVDTLLAVYWECRINWNAVQSIEKHYADGMEDSVLSEVEIDRISIAVEKTMTRFIPEELTIPYSVNYSGELNAIASTGKHLLVGTSSGLAVYNGKRWHTLTTADGLPSDTVLCLTAAGDDVLIGTSLGLARYAGMRLGEIGGVGMLPVGPVTAIGMRDMGNIWLVVNNELYRYDGRKWANYVDYQIELSDTPESLAAKFGVYGTKAEQQAFLDRYFEINAETGGWGIDLGDARVVVEADTAQQLPDLPDDLLSAVKTGAVETETVDSTVTDTTAVAEVVEEVISEPVAEEVIAAIDPVAPAGRLDAGRIVRVPLLAQIKGRVNAIYVGREMNAWLGTQYGLLYFDGDEWTTPGYRRYRIKSGDSLDDLVNAKAHKTEAEREVYTAQLQAVNDFESEPMEVGRVVKIYRNPNALDIRAIVRSGDYLYLATAAGVVEFDGVYWARANVPGMDYTDAVDARTIGNELWLVSSDKVVVKARAHRQLNLMHVKWLPELADDVYYEFLSFVSGSEGWGTFGGNITFITYGTMQRMDPFGDELGEFTSFDIAATGSYGAPLSANLKIGLSVKVLYSKLSDIGTGLEKGQGTSTGFAVDFGLLYDLNRRLTLGAAITNLGPKMAYIDASQADDLPRNLAVGLAYKLLQSDYYTLLVTTEANKIVVGLDDGFSEELKQTVFNTGAEFSYAGIFAARGGYIHDEEGDVKTLTMGVGLKIRDVLDFDFSYIPSGSNDALKNTLRISLGITL
jgi:hypothetical protein